MAEQSKIAWTDSTINFWSGCTKVSPGCANCYAEARDKRHMIEDKDHWGKGAPRLKHVGAVKDALAFNRKPWICDECGEVVTPNGEHPVPFRENNRLVKCKCGHVGIHRRRIFSLSLGDWLDDEVPIEWLAEMLDTIRQCDQVTWILCTKRPENFFERLQAVAYTENDDQHKQPKVFFDWLDEWLEDMPERRAIPTNIILLASVENQAAADKRIPELLKIPAACRGLSLEPLLGPVDLPVLKLKSLGMTSDRGVGTIDWLIIGGESGPNARPCGVDWIRSLVAQGKAAGVATFVKQLGANPTVAPFDKIENAIGKSLGTLRDKKGGNPAEWPQDLKIQQWPNGF